MAIDRKSGGIEKGARAWCAQGTLPLQKYLQYETTLTRKEIKSLVSDGEILVNGKEVSDEKVRVEPSQIDSLVVAGEEVSLIPWPLYRIVLNKPAGYEVSHKPSCHPSVFHLLPDNYKWEDCQAVGRLDEDTTGLLILTNDGAFNHRVSSPKKIMEKVYEVHLKHPVDEAFRKTIQEPVDLRDGHIVSDHKVDFDTGSEKLIRIIVTEGKYHQVKRMVAACSNRVERLHRVRIGALELGDLPEGDMRFMDPSEILSDWNG